MAKESLRYILLLLPDDSIEFYDAKVTVELDEYDRASPATLLQVYIPDMPYSWPPSSSCLVPTVEAHVSSLCRHDQRSDWYNAGLPKFENEDPTKSLHEITAVQLRLFPMSVPTCTIQGSHSRVEFLVDKLSA